MIIPRTAALAGLAATALILAGCHSNTATTSAPTVKTTSTPTDSTQPTTGSSTPADNGSDPGAGPVSSGNIRVANFFAPKGQPGPGLDIYDVQLTGEAATPILTNVAYGSVSSYFQPHQIPDSIGNAPVELTAIPTGEDPVAQHGDAAQIGGFIDDKSGFQATIVLTADGDDALGGPTSLLGILSDSNRIEKGDDGQGGKGPAAPAITDGSSELLVDSVIPSNLNSNLYLMIDSSCTPPLNGDTQIPGLPLIFSASGSAITSNFAVFATTPGSHQVSVVPQAGSDEPTCKQLTPLQGTTPTTVTANQQVEVYVYGSTLTTLKLAFAPIQP